MISSFFTKEALFGVSLALMLQTNYRFLGPVGLGEILMSCYFFLVFLAFCLSGGRGGRDKASTFSLLFAGMVLLIILPVTGVSVAMGLAGSSFRDFFVYFFILFVLLLAPQNEEKVKVVVYFFLMALFFTISFQYLLGGSAAYYFSRFSGGAKNPNQLALYLVSAVVLSSLVESNLLRILVVVGSFFFGVISSSDAYKVFVVVTILVFVCLSSLPSRGRLYFVPYLMLIAFFALLGLGLAEFLFDEWGDADEGGTRTALALFAIEAWVNTPFSMIFGHGAGSYSGFFGPFEGAEAHNTALDLATVSGFFGLFFFPVLPFWLAAKGVMNNHVYIPAVIIGFVAFGFFHFVGRQPVFWVSLFLIFNFLYKESTVSD